MTKKREFLVKNTVFLKKKTSKKPSSLSFKFWLTVQETFTCVQKRTVRAYKREPVRAYKSEPYTRTKVNRTCVQKRTVRAYKKTVRVYRHDEFPTLIINVAVFYHWYRHLKKSNLPEVDTRQAAALCITRKKSSLSFVTDCRSLRMCWISKFSTVAGSAELTYRSPSRKPLIWRVGGKIKRWISIYALIFVKSLSN